MCPGDSPINAEMTTIRLLINVQSNQLSFSSHALPTKAFRKPWTSNAVPVVNVDAGLAQYRPQRPNCDFAVARDYRSAQAPIDRLGKFNVAARLADLIEARSK
jgi:hypothetical protein